MFNLDCDYMTADEIEESERITAEQHGYEYEPPVKPYMLRANHIKPSEPNMTMADYLKSNGFNVQ